MKKTIALTGWWTGWHIYPLVSIYNFLNEYSEEKYEFLWVWEEDSLEEKTAKEKDIKFLDISTWKIRRYFDWKNLYEPLKNISGFFQWIYYIWKYDIDIIISKWGFVSLPLCLAWKAMWKKIIIHESDTHTWLVNKIISKIASKVYYSFPNSSIDNKKYFLTGQILNPDLIKNIEIKEKSQKEKKEKSYWSKKPIEETSEVLIFWWSQWARSLYEAIEKILVDFPDINFSIILWSKNIELKSIFEKHSNIKIYDYLNQEDMWKIYEKTDIAISRWWATSLWELYNFGIHSIIVPLRTSAGWHQEKNAFYFKENFGSDIIIENNKLPINLYKNLKKYRETKKQWLNLKNFFKALEIIEKEIRK